MTQTPNYAAMSQAQLIGALERRDATLEAILNVIHLPNKDMAPGEKLFWIAAKSVLLEEQTNEQGLTRLPIDDIATFNGMSESSNSRYANAVLERYGATKEPVPYVTQKGQKRDLTYIDRSEQVWRDPWNVDLPEEKQRVLNGNGKFCNHCQTYNLKVTTHRLTYQEVQECECCGYKKVSKVLKDPNNVELPSGEYIPEKKGPQAGEPFGEAPISATPNPDTPPILALQDAASDFLLAMAGEHTEHIEMIPTAQKYTTVHRQLTKGDMVAHLTGSTTKGVLNRSDVGTTRALCKDADNVDEWQLCQEAARSLVLEGFNPVLIPSPVHEGKHKGGGHLWLFFDGLVDAYSAWQTVYQYAPHLREMKDGWPGGGINMRLPGGKYVHPDFTAWCPLYDAYGVELSRDGLDLAQALLTHLTPAHIVNLYERPAPEPERTREPAQGLGGYLEKDLARAVIADFNASHSWPEILGQSDRHGKYLASWRDDCKPNVAVYADTDMAYDHSTQRWFERPFDKYDAYCLVEGKAQWEAFKKADLEERCRQLRAAQQPRAIDGIPLSFKERPCARCGRYDAVQREDGLWVCPCSLPLQQLRLSA